MATQRLCSIPNCGKTHKAHGLCAAHYWHQRKYGDPLTGSNRVTSSEWVDAHKDYKSQECLIWPFSRSGRGYGKAHSGKSLTAHRLMCVAAHGPAPSRAHVAAHSCGNGHLGCVNPGHLRWATKSENEADKIVHGTMPVGSRHPNSKLSEKEVMEVFRSAGKIPLTDLAKLYGVSTPTIWKIVHGIRWTHLPR